MCDAGAIFSSSATSAICMSLTFTRYAARNTLGSTRSSGSFGQAQTLGSLAKVRVAGRRRLVLAQRKSQLESSVVLEQARTRFLRRSGFLQSRRSNALRGAEFKPPIRCAVLELERSGPSRRSGSSREWLMSAVCDIDKIT